MRLHIGSAVSVDEVDGTYAELVGKSRLPIRAFKLARRHAAVLKIREIDGSVDRLDQRLDRPSADLRQLGVRYLKPSVASASLLELRSAAH